MTEALTPTQQAAAELRSVALELFIAHTIDGVWPHGEDEAKTEHDRLLQLADQLEADAPSDIAASANHLMQACHTASHTAGWWNHLETGLDLREVMRNPADPLQRLLGGALFSQKLVLIHSEVSESMEGHRKGLQDDKLPHRPMVEVELADALIRIYDLCGAMGLDIGGAMAEKMAFNKVRPDHKPENRRAAGGKAY